MKVLDFTLFGLQSKNTLYVSASVGPLFKMASKLGSGVALQRVSENDIEAFRSQGLVIKAVDDPPFGS